MGTALHEGILACLDDRDPDQALAALSSNRSLFEAYRPSEEDRHLGKVDPVMALSVMLVAGALVRTGRAEAALSYADDMAVWLGPERRVRGRNLGYIAGITPLLMVPCIAAFIALRQWPGAIAACDELARSMRFGHHNDPWADPLAAALLSHDRIGRYGPFAFDRRWLLARQMEILDAYAPDRSFEVVYRFEELFIRNALLTEQPEQALGLIQSRGQRLDKVSNTASGHLEFNAVCALAALGRFDAALALARSIIMQGYNLPWRFDLEHAQRMAWTQEMRQNEWLGSLAQTEAYQQFLKEDITPETPRYDDPSENPLCEARDGTLGGKKRKRCWISNRLIEPGDEIVRVRRLFKHPGDGELEAAHREAFERSAWRAARRQFESDTVPPSALFSKLGFRERIWETQAISAFHWRVMRDPEAFDVAQAVRIIAEHAPNPIRMVWLTAKYQYADGLPHKVNDKGHGDAVNFTWRLLKAGLGPEIFDKARRLPPAQADKVFAMLAVFNRQDCRAAAAAHFGLADLPTMMEVAFSERLSLQAHRDMADFGRDNPRWRAGLVSAMRAYALHLYSNAHPGVNWFLAGLDHFMFAHGCRLLFFLIHHPEDDLVLGTMLEREWLPQGERVGGYDAYDNAQSFYYRAAVLNRLWHAPEKRAFWLESEWVAFYCRHARDKETRRLAARA